MLRKLIRFGKQLLKKLDYICLALIGFVVCGVVIVTVKKFLDQRSGGLNGTGSYNTLQLHPVINEVNINKVHVESLKKDGLLNKKSAKSKKLTQSIMQDAYDVAYPLFVIWREDNKSYCNGKINVVGKVLFHAEDMALNTDLIHAKADPRDDASPGKHHRAEDEQYSFDLGAFQITCPRILPYFVDVFHDDSRVPHVQEWYRSIQSNSKGWTSKEVDVIDQKVYAIARYEFTNVFWAVTDIYNVFIHCVFNEHDPSEITVLLLDAHPKSAIDDLWKGIFGKVIRPIDLPKITRFKDLTWTMSRSFTPILSQDGLNNIPYLGHLRSFILAQFALQDPEPMNCPSLRITFIWRRDYISHPRNRDGLITRKISNEAELLNKTKELFPNWSVAGHQLDALPISDQIRILSQTDILVGMHGAALAFSFLISPGGGVVELFPKYYGSNEHMMRIAKSSGLSYLKWHNDNDALENIYKKTTEIPTDVMTDLISKMSTSICLGRKGRLQHEEKPVISLNKLKKLKKVKHKKGGGKRVHVRNINND